MWLGRLACALRDGDALPSELFDRDEGLFEVCVLGHEVRAQVESEAFRNQDVRRCLRKI